ncbi:hypothetical protein B296_00021711 [Ensete ventricosum]|uniref:Uncharacterized protein n=1 Tax=Ensete ventricosum TaxID=4639 RepID=A0A426ZGX6_ENSVE|nr:hypothetical protein B296_00021711 [Ensete ventricosum]
MEKVMPLSESALSLANSTLKNALSAAKNLSTEINNEDLLGNMMEAVTGSQKINVTGLHEFSNNVDGSASADLLKGTVIGSSHLSDVTTLAVGYMFIFCFIFFYFGLLALIRYSRGGAGQNDQPLVPRIAAEDHQGRVDIVGNADAAEESDVDDPADSE